MQENNITDISTGINASMGHISMTETGPREHVWSGPILRGSVRRQTERILGGQRCVWGSGSVCPCSWGYYFSFLLSGGPFCYVTVVPTLTVHERVMRDVSLWEHALCKNYLGVISFFKSLRTFTSRQSEKYCSFGDLDLWIVFL